MLFAVLLVFFAGMSSSLNAQENKALNWGDVTVRYSDLQSFQDSALNEFCFIRAHYWARQLELKFATESYKAFVLFTPIFQRKHNLNWWYHVVPVVRFRDESGNITEAVMDKAHYRSPLLLSDWLRRFSPTGCREGQGLEDYDNELIFGGCVLVRKSKYYFTPDDFDRDLTNWVCKDWHRLKIQLENDAQKITFDDELVPPRCR
jgi:hypothetical protein